MKVAIYGRPIELENFKSFFKELKSALTQNEIDCAVLDTYAEFLKQHYHISCNTCSADDISSGSFDYLISLGGDGTILDTLQLVKDSGIPVMGINLGRLGFLANIQMSECATAINFLKRGEFQVDDRAVLHIKSDKAEIDSYPYALNDVVVQKRDSSAMITVKTWLNNEFLNAYWADGLIVATPTGSSGYSMSCGGPLIVPGSDALALTPIAAHNLTVRPIVIPDKHELRFEVDSRADTVLISMDSRSFQVAGNAHFQVSRAPFNFRMIRMNDTSYLDTIRNKLMWGKDNRNEK
ncbi:NAD kinase [bacterium]|nr:NAD kinase [bacterium]